MSQIKKLFDCQQNQAPRSREPCLLPEPIRMIKGTDPGPADSSSAWEHWAKTPGLERKGGDPLPMRRQSRIVRLQLGAASKSRAGFPSLWASTGSGTNPFPAPASPAACWPPSRNNFLPVTTRTNAASAGEVPA